MNVVDGVVYLRGEVQEDLVKELESAARKVSGVKDVENLLHAPGSPAPQSWITTRGRRAGVGAPAHESIGLGGLGEIQLGRRAAPPPRYGLSRVDSAAYRALPASLPRHD